MDNLELCHHGILGMKWGVRRFQNADGSLTAAGKKRYGISDKMLTTAKTAATTSRGISNTVGTVARSRAASRSRNRYDQRKVLTQEEIDAMDNTELQKLVTRLNLETQYSNLTADKIAPSMAQRIATGAEYVSAILGISASIASIVSLHNK